MKYVDALNVGEKIKSGWEKLKEYLKGFFDWIKGPLESFFKPTLEMFDKFKSWIPKISSQKISTQLKIPTELKPANSNVTRNQNNNFSITINDNKNAPHDFEKLLNFTNLERFQKRLAGALSGGMKQKLGLAYVLLGSPKFLLLDELSVGVDPVSRRDLMKMVLNLISPTTTVLWSTAYLDEAHSFDTAVGMNKGRVIYQGSPTDLAETSADFENKVIDLMCGL